MEEKKTDDLNTRKLKARDLKVRNDYAGGRQRLLTASEKSTEQKEVFSEDSRDS